MTTLIPTPLIPSGASKETSPALYLQVAARFVQRIDADACRDSAVKPPFIGVLSMVAAFPDIRQGLAAEALGFDATTFGRYVDRLVREGLILRRVPEEDRRAVCLSVSEEGRQAVEACKQTLADIEADIRQQMGKEDWDRLTGLLEQFLDAFNHPLPQILRSELKTN